MGLFTRVFLFFWLLCAYLAFSSTLLAWLGRVAYGQDIKVGELELDDYPEDYPEDYDEDYDYYGDDEAEYPHYEL